MENRRRQDVETDPSLIIVNLPPLEPPKHTANSPILLRHWVSWRLRNLIHKSYLKPRFKTLGGCSCSPIPAFGTKKDGEIYATGMPGHIQIHQYDNPEKIAETGEIAPKHGYMGLSRCSSATCCPACGARIRYVRRNEIQKITQHLLTNGHSFLLQTLTAPHEFKDDPRQFVQLFQEANREMKKGKSWKAFAERWRLVHYIRSVEITDDAPWSRRRTGAHWHSHTVLFFDRGPFSKAEAERFRDEMADRWTNALVKVGLITEADRKKTWAHSVDVQRPKVADQGELSDPETIQALIEYVSKGASFELAPGTIGGKKGRKGDRITFWQLMQMALTNKPELQWRLLKFIEAQKGMHHMQFSRGLKALCGVKDVSDDEIMRGESETFVYAFESPEDRKRWKGIRRAGLQKSVLMALDESENPPAMLIDIAGGGVDPITGEVV